MRQVTSRGAKETGQPGRGVWGFKAQQAPLKSLNSYHRTTGSSCRVFQRESGDVRFVFQKTFWFQCGAMRKGVQFGVTSVQAAGLVQGGPGWQWNREKWALSL